MVKPPYHLCSPLIGYILIVLVVHAQKPSPVLEPRVTNGTLDPNQLAALEFLGVAIPEDPCNSNCLICDDTLGPHRHLVSLELQYCSPNVILSNFALANLTTLRSIYFRDCPMIIAPLPAALTESLSTFSCIESLGRTLDHTDLLALSGTWLSKLHRLKELTLKDVLVNGSLSGLEGITKNMSKLERLTISNVNISGTLPNSWPKNLTSLEISQSMIEGVIPPTLSSLTELRSLDLSSNRLTGNIPAGLENLSLLTYLDLSNNQLNGTIPTFIAKFHRLRYLDLRNNNFHGVLPFTTAFVLNLHTYRAGGNRELCFNDTVLLSTMSGGVDFCDMEGRPFMIYYGNAPSLAPMEGVVVSLRNNNKGKTSVLVVSIVLATLIFIIAVVVVVSRRCPN